MIWTFAGLASADPRAASAAACGVIFRLAVLDVYTLKLNAINALFHFDADKLQRLERWRRDYLNGHAQWSTWTPQEVPRKDEERNWTLGAVERFWKRYGGTFRVDWAWLDYERVQLIQNFCEYRIAPSIDNVVRATEFFAPLRLPVRANC
jgi:hypothetical protein